MHKTIVLTLCNSVYIAHVQFVALIIHSFIHSFREFMLIVM